MFVSINFYFRPYEFIAVYQRFAHNVFISYPNSICIRAVRQSLK